jgi:adenylylsulfate kinase
VREQGWVVWITGLPGSGKSVTAKALRKALLERHVPSQILSSDELRKHITPRPTYSQEERDILYNSLGFVASLLARNGINVIIDATGNLRKYRDDCRAMLARFAEVYVRCPLDQCIRREEARVDRWHAPRGIYEGALKGKAPTVPGLGSPYEEPLRPEVTVDSDKMSPDECAHVILNKLRDFLLA